MFKIVDEASADRTKFSVGIAQLEARSEAHTKDLEKHDREIKSLRDQATSGSTLVKILQWGLPILLAALLSVLVPRIFPTTQVTTPKAPTTKGLKR